jgi:hypothetical protein
VVRALVPVLAATALLVAPVAQAAPARSIGRIAHVHSESFGADESGAFCADFRLSDAQADKALRASHRLSGPEVARFDHLPCYVRGSMRLNGAPARWELRAGGDGTIMQGTRRTAIGCPSCRDTFGASDTK